MFGKLKNGKLANVGHNSKQLKGELIAELVKHDNISLEDLPRLKINKGFYYSKEFSDKDLIVYLENRL